MSGAMDEQRSDAEPCEGKRAGQVSRLGVSRGSSQRPGNQCLPGRGSAREGTSTGRLRPVCRLGKPQPQGGYDGRRRRTRRLSAPVASSTSTIVTVSTTSDMMRFMWLSYAC